MPKSFFVEVSGLYIRNVEILADGFCAFVTHNLVTAYLFLIEILAINDKRVTYLCCPIHLFSFESSSFPL